MKRINDTKTRHNLRAHTWALNVCRELVRLRQKGKLSIIVKYIDDMRRRLSSGNEDKRASERMCAYV